MYIFNSRSVDRMNYQLLMVNTRLYLLHLLYSRALKYSLRDTAKLL